MIHRESELLKPIIKTWYYTHNITSSVIPLFVLNCKYQYAENIMIHNVFQCRWTVLDQSKSSKMKTCDDVTGVTLGILTHNTITLLLGKVVASWVNAAAHLQVPKRYDMCYVRYGSTCTTRDFQSESVWVFTGSHQWCHRFLPFNLAIALQVCRLRCNWTCSIFLEKDSCEHEVGTSWYKCSRKMIQMHGTSLPSIIISSSWVQIHV